jgi:GMP synthase-like glutamine amidotransferase
MKIGIIETGYPPSSLGDKFGSYVDMFRQYLGGDHRYTQYKAQEDALPKLSTAEEAYIITGSSSGVYDSDPWIAQLMVFLRAVPESVKLIGVCFGHQVMAEALGGKVIQSPKGWGIGLHHYKVGANQSWMDRQMDSIALVASHQDQVVVLPPDTDIVASSAFTPYGMLSYKKRKALSIQLHPEFSPSFASALLELGRGKQFTDEQVDHAIDSLKAHNDRECIKIWLSQFLIS